MHVDVIRNDLACPISTFQVQYLGLPLSIRKMHSLASIPLVDKFAEKLSTWRASMLSLADQLSLVLHVLCAIPTHFMVIIAFSKLALARVNQVI